MCQSKRIMKKLEDLPKQNIHQVPDGYFDKLPGIIQARLSDDAPETYRILSRGWRYAVAAVLIGSVALVYVFTSNSHLSTPEELLAGIEASALEEYLLDESFITPADIAEEELTFSDAEEIENMIYLNTGVDVAAEELFNELLMENEFNSEDQ